MNKKGFELSIQTLVIVLLGIFFLTFGIIFIDRFFSSAEDIKTSYDQATAEELDILLSEGQLIATPFNSKTASAGESVVFGVGILNRDITQTTFYVYVSCSKYIDDTGSNDCAASGITVLHRGSTSPITLQSNEDDRLSVVVNLPDSVSSGQYIFDVDVYTDQQKAQRYGTKHKLYITVN